MRKLEHGKLVVATHNAGKLREMADLLAPYGLETVSAGELGLPEPEETGTTFHENALLKAHAAARGANIVALADDSGLAVNGLGGEPGIHSARWAGPTRDFDMAMELVWDKLGDTADRGAHFVSVLALAWPDGHSECFEGRVYGSLVWPPRGDRGFGYDPMFVPEGETLTYGEMDPAIKHSSSHRAVAFRKLTDACFDR